LAILSLIQGFRQRFLDRQLVPGQETLEILPVDIER